MGRRLTFSDQLGIRLKLDEENHMDEVNALVGNHRVISAKRRDERVRCR